MLSFIQSREYLEDCDKDGCHWGLQHLILDDRGLATARVGSLVTGMMNKRECISDGLGWESSVQHQHWEGSLTLIGTLRKLLNFSFARPPQPLALFTAVRIFFLMVLCTAGDSESEAPLPLQQCQSKWTHADKTAYG